MISLRKSVPKDYEVTLKDGSQLDGANRLKVSNVHHIFENKNIFTINDNEMLTELGGVGASVTHLPNESSVQLQVGTGIGEFVIRQSYRYMPYIPGSSQGITMTGVLGRGKANVTKRIGYFDNNDGLFFELADLTLRVVRRTSTSGSPVDIQIDQANWNLDKLDGTGPSGITFDDSKAQIFMIDFLWLGTGQIRYSLQIDGKSIPIHEINNANVLGLVYMSTPTLPVRYEIRNTGASLDASILKEICISVISDAGQILPGYEFSSSNLVTTRAVTTRIPVLAVRLKNSFGGKDNRRTMRILKSSNYAITNDALFEVAHLHGVSAVTGTFNDVDTSGSAVEFSTNITSITAADEHIINLIYVPAGLGSSATSTISHLEFINFHSFANQNFDSTGSEYFVIYATSFGGTTNVSASISWIESD